jgi:ABC-type proline/glycine betaine transport system substrate-binding protein
MRKISGKSPAEAFDWHSDPIKRTTPVTATYRNTQNVRRFFKAICGEHFKFDVSFMAWMKNGKPKTMGEAAQEWLRRNASRKA